MGILEQAREIIIARERRDEKIKTQTSIAKKMKKFGFSDTYIVKSTGLKLKQVQAL